MGGDTPLQVPPWVQHTGLSAAHSLPPPRSVCVHAHTGTHAHIQTSPRALTHSSGYPGALSSLVLTHTLTRSHLHPTPRPLGHWGPIEGTLSSSWAGPLPTPEMAREERVTGRGKVCTDVGGHTVKAALTAFLKVTGKAVTREGSPGEEEEDGGGPSGPVTTAVRDPGASAPLSSDLTVPPSKFPGGSQDRRKKSGRRGRRMEPQEEGRKEEAA